MDQQLAETSQPPPTHRTYGGSSESTNRTDHTEADVVVAVAGLDRFRPLARSALRAGPKRSSGGKAAGKVSPPGIPGGRCTAPSPAEDMGKRGLNLPRKTGKGAHGAKAQAATAQENARCKFQELGLPALRGRFVSNALA